MEYKEVETERKKIRQIKKEEKKKEENKVPVRVEKSKSYYKAKKEKIQIKKLRKTLRKIEKKKDKDDDEEKLYDDVEFGEQAEQPPELKFEMKKKKN